MSEHEWPDPQVFDPFQPFRSTQELNPAVILNVLDGNSNLSDFQRTLDFLVPAFQSQPEISIVFYLSSACPLTEQELENCLAAYDPEQLPDMVLEWEAIIPEPQTLPALFSQASLYLDLTARPRLYWVWCALAMNCQVLLQASSGLPVGAPVFSLPVETTQATELAREILDGRRFQRYLRAFYLSQLRQADQPGSSQRFADWLSPQLESVLERIDHLKLVEIVFWGRSGSTFVHSLLDQHPEVLSVSGKNLGEISEFPYHWSWITQQKPQSFKEIIDAFCSLFREGSANSHKAFCLFDQDSQTFEQQFSWLCEQILEALVASGRDQALSQKMRKYFFSAIHYAYALALGQDVRQKWLIVHQLHWCEDLVGLSRLREDFPDLRLIGTLRAPQRGFYSFLRYTFNDQKIRQPDLELSDLVSMRFYLNNYRHLLMGWKLAESMLQEPAYPMLLEQLHTQPEQEMQKLADWLGIQWHPSLLKSTVNGSPYELQSGVHGDLTAQQKTFDLQRAQYDKWREDMHEIEAFVLEGLMADDLEKYGLGKISTFQRTLSPLLVFVPAQLEIRALGKALRQRDEAQLKQVMLAMIERWYFSWLFLCGFKSFLSSIDLWKPLNPDLLKTPTEGEPAPSP